MDAAEVILLEPDGIVEAKEPVYVLTNRDGTSIALPAGPGSFTEDYFVAVLHNGVTVFADHVIKGHLVRICTGSSIHYTTEEDFNHKKKLEDEYAFIPGFLIVLEPWVVLIHVSAVRDALVSI